MAVLILISTSSTRYGICEHLILGGARSIRRSLRGEGGACLDSGSRGDVEVQVGIAFDQFCWLRLGDVFDGLRDAAEGRQPFEVAVDVEVRFEICIGHVVHRAETDPCIPDGVLVVVALEEQWSRECFTKVGRGGQRVSTPAPAVITGRILIIFEAEANTFLWLIAVIRKIRTL